MHSASGQEIIGRPPSSASRDSRRRPPRTATGEHRRTPRCTSTSTCNLGTPCTTSALRTSQAVHRSSPRRSWSTRRRRRSNLHRLQLLPRDLVRHRRRQRSSPQHRVEKDRSQHQRSTLRCRGHLLKGSLQALRLRLRFQTTLTCIRTRRARARAALAAELRIHHANVPSHHLPPFNCGGSMVLDETTVA